MSADLRKAYADARSRGVRPKAALAMVAREAGVPVERVRAAVRAPLPEEVQQAETRRRQEQRADRRARVAGRRGLRRVRREADD